MKTQSVCIGLKPRPSMTETSRAVMPIMPRTKFKNSAAKMISITIAVVLSVPSKTARSMVKLSERKEAAMIRAPMTPTEAASVGVARPA